MTLNELAAAISELKGWATVTEKGHTALCVPQSGNRHQSVRLTPFTNADHPMVRFTTEIGLADRLEIGRLRSALELNYRLPFGCLAIEGDQLVLTETRPLKTTTPQTSGDAIDFLARQADQYEKLIFKTDVH